VTPTGVLTHSQGEQKSEATTIVPAAFAKEEANNSKKNTYVLFLLVRWALTHTSASSYVVW